MNEKVQKLIEAEYAPQRSKEWFTLRESVITASDAGSALGLNFFKSRDQFILEKCGYFRVDGKLVECDKKPDTSSEATRYGCLHEDEARDVYVARTGEKVHEIGLVRHPVHTWLAGSPDGITESGKLLEIKCPFKKKIRAEIIPTYFVQVQLLMEILDLELCDFVQYRPGDPCEFLLMQIHRDRQWFAKVLPDLKNTWDEIVRKRTHGLCDIEDDPVQDLPQDEHPAVPDVQAGLLCEASPAGASQLSGSPEED